MRYTLARPENTLFQKRKIEIQKRRMEILFKTGKMEIPVPSKDTNYKKSKYPFKNDKENHRVFKKENGSPFF